jgi:hypothetical protein
VADKPLVQRTDQQRFEHRAAQYRSVRVVLRCGLIRDQDAGNHLAGLAVFGHFGALVFGSRSGGSSTFPEVPFSLSGGAPNHVGARLADYLDRLSRILSVSDVTPSGARVYAAVAVDLKHDASGKSVKPSGGTMR